MQDKKKVVCVHLLNDYSGSPLVLSMVIKGLRTAGHEVELITSSAGNGFLSGLDVSYTYIKYTFHKNKFVRLWKYFKSQMQLFFLLRKYKGVHIYINTLLPFGAALAGRWNGNRVTYHLHESYIQPELLKRFLKFVVSKCADTAIYVSNYLLNTEEIPGIKNTVIYNALPDEFASRAALYRQSSSGFMVLMISSLKEYKGIREFAMLASRLPHLQFELVLNARQEEIDEYFSSMKLSDNLKLFPAQSDVHSFYQRASLVVNMSIPELCVETFGMTLLEAMCYGIPVIAPPAGGPAEIVQDGINGFCINAKDEPLFDETITAISNDRTLQQRLSQAAVSTSKRFDEKVLQKETLQVIEEKKTFLQ